MEHSAGISSFAGFVIAWLLAVGWFSYRAIRRGDGAVRVISKGLLSVALAGGLVFYIRRKLDTLTGDFAGDAASVLLIAGLVALGGVLMSILWSQDVAELVASPLANLFDGGSEPPDPAPPPAREPSLAARQLLARADKMDPGAFANACVQFLAAHPEESVVREKLAVLYARHFKRLDLATLEFEQLIREPVHPPRLVARWLKLLAKMQIELHADAATVEATMKRVEERFPNDTEAAAVRQRQVQAAEPAKEN